MQNLYFDTSVPSNYCLLEKFNAGNETTTYQGRVYVRLGTAKDLTKTSQKLVTIYASLFLQAKILADEGDSYSQFRLGTMYYQGIDCERNLDSAYNYYKKAANQEHVEANFNVGLMFFNGQGCKKNLRGAYAHIKQAADQGHLQAQYELGCLYFKGEGCKKNLKHSTFLL